MQVYQVRLANFRHTESLGLSGPSGESDSVFLGEPPEDELFGLPGGNYPKSQNNLAMHRQQSYMGMGFGGGRSGRDKNLLLSYPYPPFVNETGKHIMYQFEMEMNLRYVFRVSSCKD